MRKLLRVLLTFLGFSVLTPSEGQYKVLHQFGYPNGQQPRCVPVISGSKMFGTCPGTFGTPTIFSLDTNGAGFKILYGFSNTSYGNLPYGSLTLSGSMLYGTAENGAKGYGSIFVIDTGGITFRKLFAFNDTNGAFPFGTLTLSGTKLFGFTREGGSHNAGCVFSLDTNGNNYKILLEFDTANGADPYYFSLALTGKTLYGMTSQGGAQDSGLIFSIDTDGANYRDLHDFTMSTGAVPYCSVTQVGNKLFGMTYWGGVKRWGVLFSIDTTGADYKVLVNFTGAANGRWPWASLTSVGRTLYGTTTQGGIYDDGIIFSIDTSGNGFTTLHTFNDSAGAAPWQGVTILGDMIYGYTANGGFPTNVDAGVAYSLFTCTLGTTATTISNVTCNGDNTGSATAIPSGGLSPFTYVWSGTITQSNVTATGLSAGTYTVTVNDANGCTATASVTITQPTAVTITASTTANVSCNGGSTGFAKADSASGGTPYEYIYDVAGNQDPGFTGDGGLATSAEIYWPSGVGVDASDNVYIADTYNNAIRLVTASTGIISTYAGMPRLQGHGGDGGPATAAKLNYPTDAKVDAYGNIYIADQSNNEIREVNHTTGIITTIAGTYAASGYTGDGGQATAAELYIPAAVAFDASNNIYIADFGNNVIREINYSTGIITTIAGNGTAAYSGDGGNASAAELNAPSGVAVDGSGNVYIADGYNSRIRLVNTSGIISTVAGNGTTGYTGDGGQATSAELYDASGVAVDLSGNLYISDIYNNVIREVNVSTGIISTVAGDGYKAGTGNGGFSGNGGAATAAEMYNPTNIAVDNSGNIYIADTYNSEIREVKSNYNYVWSPTGGTNLTASNLSAGTYTITATDMNGCTGKAVVTISQPNQLSASATISSNVLCYGGSTGSASSVISGGTSPYTYAWSNSQTTSSVSSLSMGTYTLTVSDSCGATATSTITIFQPNQLNVTANVIATPSCNGYNNGSASSTVTGGTKPYTYLWSNSETTPTATGLSSGSYTVTVQDSCGGSATASVNITQPNVLSATGYVAGNEVCNGGFTGVANASVSGGTTPYTYEWSPSYTPEGPGPLTGMSAGSYTLIVLDNNGCTKSSTVAITQPAPLNDSIYPPFNVSCNGGNNGSASAAAYGGTLPYTYRWSNSQTTANASLLSAGTYTLTVTDSCGASATTSVSITQPTPIVIVADSIADNGSCNGAAWVHASGGDSNYTYKWTGGNTIDSIYSQCYGYYCCVVTDGGLCKDSVCIHINLTTGTNQLAGENEGVTVYPNPSNGLFTIALGHAELVSASQPIIEVYNVLGQKVYSQSIVHSSSFIVDLRSKPNGIYFYRVLNNDGSVMGTGKIVIER